MRTFYFDLDGTILEVKERLYSLYVDIVSELGGKTLAKGVYWQAKRGQMPEEIIAQKSNIGDVPRYISLRQERIELPEYLEYDKLIPQALESLAQLKQTNRIALVTLRKSKDNLYEQLHRLALELLFDRVLVGNEGEEHGWQLKAKMISGENGFEPRGSVIVGDTETEILAGKFLNISTVAVLSGMRTKNKLAVHQPDYIIKDISQLSNVLGNLPGSSKGE